MKWKNILNKQQSAGLAMVSVFIMVLVISIMNKRHVLDLEYSLTTIYDDRLMAENHIFNLSKKIYQKKILLNADEDRLMMSRIHINDSINLLIADYEETKLTMDEAFQLKKLKSSLGKAELFENQFVYSSSAEHRNVLNPELRAQYEIILADLEGLAMLQLHEGQKLIDQSHRIAASSNVTTRLEVGLLIILGLMTHIIFAARPPAPKYSYFDNLN